MNNLNRILSIAIPVLFLSIIREYMQVGNLVSFQYIKWLGIGLGLGVVWLIVYKVLDTMKKIEE